MNLERYWAKPDKTIQQHINDLLTHLETLKTMGYIDSDDLYELVKQACYYHDIGKVTERFQQRVLAKEKQYFDPDREIPHNVLSVYFVNEDQVQKIKGHDKRDYARVCFAVMYHHDYCDPIKTILEREDTIKENLAEVKNEIFKLSQKFYTQLAMVKDIEDIRAVKIKGYLHKCDYSASGNYMIEYPHDFLEQGLENCMRKWQRKNPNVEWNSLQRFCMEKQNQNIIAIAQTGMGKTEGGLWWIGNHKGYLCYHYELRLMQSMTECAKIYWKMKICLRKSVFFILNRWSIMSKRMWEQMKKYFSMSKGEKHFLFH